MHSTMRRGVVQNECLGIYMGASIHESSFVRVQQTRSCVHSCVHGSRECPHANAVGVYASHALRHMHIYTYTHTYAIL
jgi:hypothetical protein